MSSDKDGDSVIGRWITEEEDFVIFDPPRGPVDMSALSSGASGFECLKQDSQKDDKVEILTYMWDHFSRSRACRSSTMLTLRATTGDTSTLMSTRGGIRGNGRIFRKGGRRP